jgi:DNA anti-recombination protein RmuC
MVAVQHALVGDDDSTLLSQAKLIRQDSNDRLDRLRQSQAEFMQRMADNNSKALIQALQEVIRDFNTKISEQFGSNFRQLNEAVGKLLVWQENYRLQLTELIEQQKRSSDSMRLAADRYEALVSKAETFTEIAEHLSELLQGLETQKAQLTESSRALAALLSKASDSLPNVERKIVELTEQVTLGVKQNQDEMTKVIQRASSALADNVAQLNSEMADALQKSNAQVNDHLKHLSDKTTEQVAKLDLALETELSKSISTLGRQLTALSGRFVEDYTPLTERLRALIQVAQRG